MNATGIQNYLSNVFRPIVVYDSTAANFTPKLELSNIDNYSGNTISVFTAAIGDSNSNVYVGSNAGNQFNITRNCSNISAFGFGAASNVSNVSNSVFLGWYAGASTSNTTDVISIGKRSGGNGSANIFMGTNTGLSNIGTSNILLGHYIDLSSASNQVRIGYSNQIPIAADISNKWVGLGGYTSPVFPNDKVDVSGNLYVLGNIGINTESGAEATLDVNGNFQSDDGHANLRFLTTANNSALTFSNYSGGTSSLTVGGFTKSTTGFSSIQSEVSLTLNAAATIGTVRRGIFQVSAVEKSLPTFHYGARVFFAFTNSNVAILSDVSLGDLAIQTSGSNIQLSNLSGGSVREYDYALTYFPLT
jgi:hypothetical protein